MDRNLSKLARNFCALFFCLLIFTGASFAAITKFADIKVSGNGDGVLVEWRTDVDVQNFGFNVYRVEGKNNVLINEEIIVGSALVAAENINSDNSYRFFDPNGTVNAEYFIEAVNVKGEKQYSDRIPAEFDSTVSERRFENSKTIIEIGRDTSNNSAISIENPTPPFDKQFQLLNSEPAQNSETQRWVAAQPGAKISVCTKSLNPSPTPLPSPTPGARRGCQGNGLYRVTRTELAQTNFNVNAPVSNWQLYADGIEQPLIVEPNGEYIEFYGRGIDTQYSDTRVYYLVVGNAPGRRMATLSRRLNATRAPATNFQNETEHKLRSIYSQNILNGESVENFWGPGIFASGNPTNISINIKSIDYSLAQTKMSVRLQGFSATPHSVRVSLNNTVLGVMDWSGQELFEKQFTFSTSLLNNGSNTLSFIPTVAGILDSSLFDVAKIEYNRLYQADSDRLLFTTQNARPTVLQGFTSQNVRVFDLTDPNGTALVSVKNEGNNIFIPANRSRLMFAVGESAILQADTVTSNTVSTALTTAANKDLVIISHKAFQAQSEILANYRRGQNLTVHVVDVEDVYDESGFGTPAVTALRSFLQTVSPKYALLIGDSTYDPRNYLQKDFSNFVPTFKFETPFNETVTDELIVDFDNDNIGDFPLGRIPVKTATEAQIVVEKIQKFELTVGTALNQRGATFISDTPDGFDFRAFVQRLRNQLPANAPADFIHVPDAPAGTIRQQIIERSNAGRFIIGYAGHGSLSSWSNSTVFRNADVQQLTNANNLFLFLPMNCLNGAFADAVSDSLGEVILRHPNGGAVLTWSSSGLTYPDMQEPMSIRFFQAIGNKEFERVGDAIKASKAATSDHNVRLSWILLGDPTLKVR